MDKTTPVRNLIAAWGKLDLDYMLEQFTEDAVFENVPMEVIVGKRAIREAMSAFISLCAAAPWQLKNIAVTDRGTVMTERDDIFDLKDGRRAHVRVMGSFDVNDQGLITHWRDYFDLAEWNREMQMDPDSGRRLQSA